jgi:hypothetical protein
MGYEKSFDLNSGELDGNLYEFEQSKLLCCRVACHCTASLRNAICYGALLFDVWVLLLYILSSDSSRAHSIVILRTTQKINDGSFVSSPWQSIRIVAFESNLNLTGIMMTTRFHYSLFITTINLYSCIRLDSLQGLFLSLPIVFLRDLRIQIETHPNQGNNICSLSIIALNLHSWLGWNDRWFGFCAMTFSHQSWGGESWFSS